MISSARIRDLPIAVVDVETTGLHPRGDRIIEIAVVRLEPDGTSRTVVDTLVNPRRPVSATEIHGITDEDVLDAPAFDEIAPVVAEALSGAVFASYNVYFDSKFVAAELARTVRGFPPHVCLMYLRPGLGMGKRATLSDTCNALGVPHSSAHFAADDAEAAAALWRVYLKRMAELQVETYGDLGRRLSYKFVQSFSEPILTVARLDRRATKLKSRRTGHFGAHRPEPVPINPIAEYWDALKTALADFNVSAAELHYLSEKREQLRLSDASVRALHARAFTGLLAQLSDDHAIDDSEVAKVAMMAEALRKLGWSPGDRIGAEVPKPGIIARLLGR